MRLHVVGLPHTNLTAQFSWCAYTAKVAKFAKMMTDQGCEVVTYGNGEAELAGKYVKVTDMQFAPFFVPDFTPEEFLFKNFNAKAIAALVQHLESGDIICLIGGTAQKPIADALGHWPVVEFGVGYTGTFAKYRVFESHIWANHVYGIDRAYGSEFDAVIPNYFDPKDFAVSKGRDYFAFLGRITGCKGIDIAIAACKKAGVPLKIGGHVFEDAEYVKDLTGEIEYVGELDPKGRKDLLGHAIATFCPSRYIEPFCGVHIESLLSGTPVIVSDWGIFPETVRNGHEGWRCRGLDDYVKAIGSPAHDPAQVLRREAVAKYSLDAVGPLYADYLATVT